jgi:hypothetical protein
MENGTKGKRKRQTSVCFLQMENRKQKFVFLSQQTISGNRRLLFQQTCPSMSMRIYETLLILRDMRPRRIYGISLRFRRKGLVFSDVLTKKGSQDIVLYFTFH